MQVLLTIESRRSKRRAPTPLGLSEPGRGWEARAAIPIFFLADQLTLSQPGGGHIIPTQYYKPPGFSDLATALTLYTCIKLPHFLYFHDQSTNFATMKSYAQSLFSFDSRRPNHLRRGNVWSNGRNLRLRPND